MKFVEIISRISGLERRDYSNIEEREVCTNESKLKHLPAVILNVFFGNILGLCLISLYQFKKISFTMVLYEKNLEMLGIFDYISSNVLLSSTVKQK